MWLEQKKLGPGLSLTTSIQEIFTADPLGDIKAELESWNLKIGRDLTTTD